MRLLIAVYYHFAAFILFVDGPNLLVPVGSFLASAVDFDFNPLLSSFVVFPLKSKQCFLLVFCH